MKRRISQRDIHVFRCIVIFLSTHAHTCNILVTNIYDAPTLYIAVLLAVCFRCCNLQLSLWLKRFSAWRSSFRQAFRSRPELSVVRYADNSVCKEKTLLDVRHSQSQTDVRVGIYSVAQEFLFVPFASISSFSLSPAVARSIATSFVASHIYKITQDVTNRAW